MNPLPTLAPAESHPVETDGMAADERALIESTLSGDTSAYGELVRRHHGRVFNYVYQMTRHRQDAEDLTQQTFIKAFHHLGTVDSRRPLINWLITIARNNTLNHFRDVKRWTEIPEDTASSGPSPARVAEIAERTQNLWDRARAILSAREFEVLWLRYGEELSTRETAQVVGLTETHVKVVLYRARQALQEGERP